MIFSLLYFTWLFVYIKRNVFFAWFDENQLHKIGNEHLCYTVWGSGDLEWTSQHCRHIIWVYCEIHDTLELGLRGNKEYAIVLRTSCGFQRGDRVTTQRVGEGVNPAVFCLRTCEK